VHKIYALALQFVQILKNREMKRLIF